MYNHNNNGKYLIHYGRKGMKWGQHIFTQDEGLGGLFRRKKEDLEKRRNTKKKIDELISTGEYSTITVGRDGRLLMFTNTIKDSKGKDLKTNNYIRDVDRLSAKDIDDALRTLNDTRGIESRASGLISGLRESYNRNDLGANVRSISQTYVFQDGDPRIHVLAPNVDGAHHYGSGVYYVNTDEFGKNDFVIDG